MHLQTSMYSNRIVNNIDKVWMCMHNIIMIMVISISGCPMHHADNSDDNTPLVARQMGKSKTDCSGNAYAIPSRRPWPHKEASQALQIRALKKPNGLYAKIFKLWFKVVQLSPSNQFKKRLTFGQNFCYAFSAWFCLNGMKWWIFFLSLLKPEHSVWEHQVWRQIV